jgi:hypothetical protein
MGVGRIVLTRRAAMVLLGVAGPGRARAGIHWRAGSTGTPRNRLAKDRIRSAKNDDARHPAQPHRKQLRRSCIPLSGTRSNETTSPLGQIK